MAGCGVETVSAAENRQEGGHSALECEHSAVVDQARELQLPNLKCVLSEEAQEKPPKFKKFEKAKQNSSDSSPIAMRSSKSFLIRHFNMVEVVGWWCCVWLIDFASFFSSLRCFSLAVRSSDFHRSTRNRYSPLRQQHQHHQHQHPCHVCHSKVPSDLLRSASSQRAGSRRKEHPLPFLPFPSSAHLECFSACCRFALFALGDRLG